VHAVTYTLLTAVDALLLTVIQGFDCRQGHWEKAPYDNSSMRSAYHVRELDVYRLLQIHRPLDVFLSHDWPRGIAYHGNTSRLFKAKPFLRSEVPHAAVTRFAKLDHRVLLLSAIL